MSYDLLIRNARICDGTGTPAFHGAVGIRAGRIVEVGKLSGRAARTIDAEGQVLAPGFIDIHTHYDAQVSWDPLLECSGWHGVTSVLMGNCGVGVAPCRPGDKEVISWDLVNVEAMPHEVLLEGVTWDDWESFPQYIETIEKRGLGLNAGFLAPLSSFRYYVMREASTERGANAEELQRMVAIFRQAMEAGAYGFSLSLFPAHIGYRGKPLSSRMASKEELCALGRVMREAGRGVIELALNRTLGQMHDEELDLLLALAEESRRPITWIGLIGRSDTPEACRSTLAKLEPHLKGSKLRPQVGPRPIKQYYTLKVPSIFSAFPSWRQAFNRTVAEQLALYRSADFRAAFRKDLRESLFLFKNQWDRVHVVKAEKEHNKPWLNKSIEEISRALGRDPVDALLDLAIDENLELGITLSVLNTNQEEVLALITHPSTIVGLSDAGAHVDQHCEAGVPTYLLGEWVRNRGAISLEEGVRMLTSDPAGFLSQPAKGRIAPGMDADVVVFDPDAVGVLPPEWVNDLPGGKPRIVERATGVRHTIVGGQPLYSDGVYQGGLPGKVMRPVREN